MGNPMSDQIRVQKQETPKQKTKRIPRDYFKINDTPDNVAKAVANTKPKKQGNWDFQNRD